eukprot:54768-Prymnesium_polylepis.1
MSSVDVMSMIGLRVGVRVRNGGRAERRADSCTSRYKVKLKETAAAVQSSPQLLRTLSLFVGAIRPLSIVIADWTD